MIINAHYSICCFAWSCLVSWFKCVSTFEAGSPALMFRTYIMRIATPWFSPFSICPAICQGTISQGEVEKQSSKGGDEQPQPPEPAAWDELVFLRLLLRRAGWSESKTSPNFMPCWVYIYIYINLVSNDDTSLVAGLGISLYKYPDWCTFWWLVWLPKFWWLAMCKCQCVRRVGGMSVMNIDLPNREQRQMEMEKRNLWFSLGCKRSLVNHFNATRLITPHARFWFPGEFGEWSRK